MNKKFDNTNRGVLFKNDKQGNEKRPDYTGKINVEGTDFRLSAWIKEGDTGKYMSLSVEKRDARTGAAIPRSEGKTDMEKGQINDPDDAIPF